MTFRAEKEMKESTLFIQIMGVMDYSTIESFQIEIPENADKIAVDFSGLEFIDSTGIGSILTLIYEARDRNKDIEFEGLNHEVRELFETVGVFRIMEALRRGGR